MAMYQFKNQVMRASLVLLWVLACIGGTAQASETITYFHNDISGSPVVATDASGNVVWKENYRPYGDRLEKQAASSNNSLWFAGKPADGGTGLSYFGARYYDPVLGRFVGVDPASFDPNNLHSFNRYAYANNNPYKFVDPDGRSPLVIIPLVMVGGGAINGSVNAVTQYATTGQVQWRGLGGVIDAAGDGVMLGLMTGPAMISTRTVASGSGGAATVAESTVQANKAAGDAFEGAIGAELRATHEVVAPQVTIRTPSGARTRVDFVTRDGTQIGCVECKASATAPLTRNQAAAFPEIQQSGGVVVGKGKPGVPGGTVIPPGTQVTIRRP